MAKIISNQYAEVLEFHVAPQVTPTEGLPYHEWFIEFEKAPDDLEKFAAELDKEMQAKNIYYKDLITGSVLRPLVITMVNKGGFQNMMKKRGKLGGQNKVPRLANDRSVADLLA